jgi:DNA repair protein RecO (recombination protein O)
VQWADIGIVLGARRHGETSAVVELMTREHGRHLGLVRGGSGSRHKPMLQVGNLVSATWRARLDEHLGYYVIEGLDLRAASYLSMAHALYGLNHLAALCRLLPERDPHPSVFALLEHTIAHLSDPSLAAALVARFELELLAELGFGLDLESCAATGATAELIYVSPKSGRAVSREAGEPWRDKLLALPAFLGADLGADGQGAQSGAQSGAPSGMPSAAELRDGFALTGFFLARHVYDPRGEPLPESRYHFIAAAVGGG